MMVFLLEWRGMAKKTIKIISWNVNGIRAVLKKGFLKFVKAQDPDILCLQETKAERGQVELDLPQYEEYWNSALRKGYAGTAIFTKAKPHSILFDLDTAVNGELKDAFGNTQTEGRVVTAEYDDFYLVNVYTPNAKRDLERLSYRHKIWDPLFLKYLKKLEKKKPVIVCGDFNVAHEEIDLARPKDNMKNAGFTSEEREGFSKLVKAGFVDTFRELYPDQTEAYSWWSHFAQARERNIGWRIDYFCISPKLKPRLKDAFILPDVLGSDHCPVGIELSV